MPDGNLTQGKRTEPIARISLDNGIFIFQYADNNTNSTVWPCTYVVYTFIFIFCFKKWKTVMNENAIENKFYICI